MSTPLPTRSESPSVPQEHSETLHVGGRAITATLSAPRVILFEAATLAEPHPIDAPVVALFADAYWPAPFATLPEMRPAPIED